MAPKEASLAQTPFLKASHAAVLGDVRILIFNLSASWGVLPSDLLRTRSVFAEVVPVGNEPVRLPTCQSALLVVCLTGWSAGICVIIQP